ncbi:MAG: biotin--[Clostridia bacterium]|nr:biotin--[acetyl-CoA-carboxylase] ligase [Clostridia bacterium]
MLLSEKIAEDLPSDMKIVFYDKTDSTNTRAKEYARGKEKIEPTLFIAASQSDGRGRLGRSFSSDEGGIYMSLLMPPLPIDPMEITCRGAVAVCLCLERLYGLGVGIKWVNDIYVNGKKLAGILTEGTFDENGNLSYFVVGMGINVYKNTDLTTNLPIATTIEDVLSKRVDINELAATLAVSIADISSLESPVSEYRKRCITVGKRVTVIGYNDSYPARCIGVEDDYSLTVRRESDGELIRVFTGEVSVRLAD